MAGNPEGSVDNNPPWPKSRISTPLSPSPPVASSHRLFAPGLLRDAWRRRSSSRNKDQTVVSLTDNVKGALGLNLLHEPSEPGVDFIFVHGLRGGSRKTWSIDPEDCSSFWPAQWLPLEAGFEHARIHSFGYDSDWSKLQHSPLRIRDFAQALLANISVSQTLKRNGDIPLIFVAHSMGGLVVKQAYLLARRDPIYSDIAARVHSIYFLATPHRGADSAGFLKAYLSVSLPSGSKSYVKELLPDSQTVQDINDDFRHVCKDVHLWSFYEGVPTMGVVIVKKSSAVLGLPAERTQYIQADHRHICKFRAVTDPNYRVLVDSLKVTLEQIERDSVGRQHELIKVIGNAFDITPRPVDDLLDVQERRHHGTCDWLTTHTDFQKWVSLGTASDVSSSPGPLNVESGEHRLFWLNGPPGSGKSVATGHVIDHLVGRNLHCSYFFFKNDSKSTTTQLLLSLALQMAKFHHGFLHTILDLIRNDGEVNTQDDRAIWTTIFLGRLFKAPFPQPQYWVIDALDECPKKSLRSLIRKFGKIDPAIPLRIFVSSRPDSSGSPLRQFLNEEKIGWFELQTGTTGSVADIAAYVGSQPWLLDRLSEEDRRTILSDIIEKANGIFLWASLIVARLEEVYSIEDIRNAVDETPSEMNGFYGRILERITRSPNAEKARCILKWVICAPEPLTAEELKEVVRIDIGHRLISPASGDIFSEICGGLLTIHKDVESRIQMMHQTVKEFLTSSASKFYVEQREAHENIARLCLEHMTGRNGLRRIARRPIAASPKLDNLFTDYASSNFSYHLRNSYSTSSTLKASLLQFITTKSLVWIETIARKGKLNLFARTLHDLKSFLALQPSRNPFFSKSHHTLASWIHDLTRIISIFGPALTDAPESIYTFIPPLCPKSSFIYKNFAGSSSQSAICELNENWEERLSSLHFPAAAKSIACNDRYLAIGLADGTVRVFTNSTLEETAVLEHGRPVTRVVFGNTSNVLVSLSAKLLTFWDSQQRRIWSIPLPRIACSIIFDCNDSAVFVTFQGLVVDSIVAFRAEDGSRIRSMIINEDSFESDSDDTHKVMRRYCPDVVRLCPQLGRAATACRSSHLTVYSLDGTDNLEKLCTIEKKGYETAIRPPQVLDVVFNPTLDSDTLAVAYQDGDIVTYQVDDWKPQQIATYHIHTRLLATSADGRTLAAGDTKGDIALFVSDTLRLMHRISATEEAVKGIIFASNSLRFCDIRGRTCNIWEPSVLVREDSMDYGPSDPEETVSSTAGHFKPQPVTPLFDGDRTITAMTPGGEKFLFCSREDGSVTVHDVTVGKQVFQLRPHAVDILQLEWHPSSGVLVSIDTSRRCIGTRLSPPSQGTTVWSRLEQVFNFRAAGRVVQALIRPDGLAVLVSTDCGEDLWQENEVSTSKHSLGKSRWLLHPTDTSRLLLFDTEKVDLYRWNGLERESVEAGISLSLPSQIVQSVERPLQNNWEPRSNTGILVQTLPFQNQSGVGFLTLNTHNIQPETTSIVISCTVRKLLQGVKKILAVSRSHILFLSLGGWICSLNSKSISDAQFYARHFYVPPFWRAGGHSLIKILSKNSLAIAYRDDVVIVQGFMDFTQKVYFQDLADEGCSSDFRSLRA